ncbi:dimethyl sulfoxide reductase anchor subunit family protein [Raoultibacter phocaeensis]|uniref:dimethyl sulfoxide reductase anchor subunit family protein n=1 Tax=Raoultibacter phocaeensis TaxID=2479841 RepID=UPI001119528C|nr:DmsC/YnfH family molybdoenzyme membrane anchor subunit [Raoultibacter phocaeensis]
MTSGFDELSLAMFTTLAPGGVIAFMCMALTLFKPGIEASDETKVNRYLAVPIAVVLIGFIASATHLGTPANALHVFSGIGRSPLSNEVLSAVAFLLIAGSYWMMAFKEHFPKALARIWIAAACASGILFIVLTSLAYSVNTVPTWNTVYTPINLVFSALFAGPVLALFSLACANFDSRAFNTTLVIVAIIALAVGSIALFMHETTLAGIANNEISASELAPDYLAMIWAHIILGLVGIFCAAASLKVDTRHRNVCILRLFACLLVFAAVFVTRVDFYFLHMTVGF